MAGFGRGRLLHRMAIMALLGEPEIYSNIWQVYTNLSILLSGRDFDIKYHWFVYTHQLVCNMGRVGIVSSVSFQLFTDWYQRGIEDQNT